VERSTIHIAVLVVAEDPASVDLASATFMSDKATGAGHRIVAQEIVEDDEAAIRDQLARWVGQPHIDVVLSAGADDASAAALGPLVTKPLPGLTDQLRLLARDRKSSSRPVAARCSSKFVFLLPPEIGALGAALNQLVLPQLDSTAERNLVKEMPRHGGEAVPQVVAAEKTVTGAGLAPKIPAEPRAQRKTGANIVARNEARQAATASQDQTRVIDRDRLERQIAKSASPSHDAVTRPNIDLATMLPPVPPGASDRPDTEEDLPLDSPALDDPTLENPTAPAIRTVQPARLRGGPGPIGTAKPARPASAADEAPTTRAASKPSLGVPAAVTPTGTSKHAASGPLAAKPVATAPVAAKPAGSAPVAASTPVVAKPVASTPVAAKPVVSAPVAAKPVASTPVAAKPVASTPVAAKPVASTPVAAKPVTSAATSKELPKPTPVSGVTATNAPANGQPRPAPIGVVRREALEAAAAEEEIEAASSSDILEAVSAEFEELSTPPAPPKAPPIPPRPATGPAPVVPPRPATGPAPIVPRPATGPAPIVATSAAPSQPFSGPDLFQLPEGTQKRRRARTGTALMRRSKRSVALTIVLLTGAAVAGFFAVVHFFPQFMGGDDSGSKGSAVVATQPGSATPPPAGSSADPVGSAAVAQAGSAEPAPPPPAGSSAAPEPAAVAVAEPAPPTTTTTPPVAHPTAHKPAGAATTAPVTHPDSAKTEVAKADTAKTEAAKPAGPPEPPPVEDGCDEVSCVMDHYEKACCARYKPAADSGFHPKGSVPDQLDRSMVKSGIEKVKPKVVACGEKIATKGEVKLSITVAPDGSVKSIAVDSAPDSALGDCVLAAVKRARFGQANGETSFVYPFVF
jgi:TonB family protein